MSALRSGRRLNSHSAASSTQRKPFQIPAGGARSGVAREQQREHDGEGDERQALVRHEDTAPMNSSVKPVPTFAT